MYILIGILIFDAFVLLCYATDCAIDRLAAVAKPTTIHRHEAAQ